MRYEVANEVCASCDARAVDLQDFCAVGHVVYEGIAAAGCFIE
jgi:hypothetical protein